MSRTVFVTGGAAGIGSGIVAAFAAAGDRVFAVDISAERLAKAVALIGGQVEPVVLDVSDEDAVQAAIGRVHASAGSLDVVVNNAGVADGKPDVTDMTTSVWERVLAINLTGTFYCAREAARIMVPQGHGRIINIASISVFSGRANGVAYSASKAGVYGLTRRMAIELAPHNVTSNCVLVGGVDTEIWSTSQDILGTDFHDHEPLSEEVRDVIVPARRFGTAEEIAAAVMYLASDAAGFVNGVALPVDGGQLAV
jgi:NAD(P)-dependent dehydrogenase (short-subunit alcohol dehydrogenase family)